MSNRKLIVVDVEADGQVPHLYSMVCFGAVVVEEGLNRTFYGKMAPISDDFVPEALAISGFTREEHESFPPATYTMEQFYEWLKEISPKEQLTFLSDNNGFDWQFINYYFHRFIGKNPFGWSSRRIGDIYCGMQNDYHAKWKHLRDTKHDHHPVNDAKGNAEVIIKMKTMGLKLNL